MMKGMSTLTALGFGLISFSALSANDNNFQNEITINYMDYSSSKSAEEPTWKAKYSYYGSAISQSDSPYQLNRFMAQTTVLDLTYTNNDRNDSYGIGGEYVFDSKWFIGGDYQYADNDVFGHSHVYSANFGYYANDYTKLFFAATKSDTGNSFIDLETDTYSLGVNSFIATELGEGVYISANYSHTETETKSPFYNDKTDYRSWEVSADYYLTNSFSVGGKYNDSTFEGLDDTYSVNAAYFLRIIDNLSLKVNVDKQIEPSISGFTYDIALVGRF